LNPSRAGQADYLSREEFVEEMARVAAAFPYFNPPELTWEVYWNDLHFIPRWKLISGLALCRMTLKFFPSVSEVIEAAIGNDYNEVEYQPTRPATIRDIIIAHMKKKETWEKLLQAQPQGAIGSRH
jgi:hypothetical protein